SGRRIVNPMSAKKPASRRSPISRSVSAYGSAAYTPQALMFILFVLAISVRVSSPASTPFTLCGRATHQGRRASNGGHDGSEPGGSSMYGRTQTATVERLWENVGLVVGAAAITAICAQISFGYPVPTTLQTFAVLGSGALLGARRGAASQLLYLGVGAVGMPVFANADGGLICERYGRSFYVTVPAMLLGSVVLYATGLAWLHQAIPTPWTGAGVS